MKTQKFRITAIQESVVDVGDRDGDGYRIGKPCYSMTLTPVDDYPISFGTLTMKTFNQNCIGRIVVLTVTSSPQTGQASSVRELPEAGDGTCAEGCP